MTKKQRYDLWERLFVAAITGCCADSNLTSHENVVSWSRAVADLGVNVAEEAHTNIISARELP